MENLQGSTAEVFFMKAGGLMPAAPLLHPREWNAPLSSSWACFPSPSFLCYSPLYTVHLRSVSGHKKDRLQGRPRRLQESLKSFPDASERAVGITTSCRGQGLSVQ